MVYSMFLLILLCGWWIVLVYWIIRWFLDRLDIRFLALYVGFYIWFYLLLLVLCFILLVTFLHAMLVLVTGRISFGLEILFLLGFLLVEEYIFWRISILHLKVFSFVLFYWWLFPVLFHLIICMCETLRLVNERWCLYLSLWMVWIGDIPSLPFMYHIIMRAHCFGFHL